MSQQNVEMGTSERAAEGAKEIKTDIESTRNGSVWGLRWKEDQEAEGS
jgi:hypothetical protein